MADNNDQEQEATEGRVRRAREDLIDYEETSRSNYSSESLYVADQHMAIVRISNNNLSDTTSSIDVEGTPSPEPQDTIKRVKIEHNYYQSDRKSQSEDDPPPLKTTHNNEPDKTNTGRNTNPVQVLEVSSSESSSQNDSMEKSSREIETTEDNINETNLEIQLLALDTTYDKLEEKLLALEAKKLEVNRKRIKLQMKLNHYETKLKKMKTRAKLKRKSEE